MRTWHVIMMIGMGLECPLMYFTITSMLGSGLLGCRDITFKILHGICMTHELYANVFLISCNIMIIVITIIHAWGSTGESETRIYNSNGEFTRYE